MSRQYPVIDWQRVALNIQIHMPLERASLKIGRHRSYLSHVARNEITSEPKFTDALRLLDMHLDLCGIEAHRKVLR